MCKTYFECDTQAHQSVKKKGKNNYNTNFEISSNMIIITQIGCKTCFECKSYISVTFHPFKLIKASAKTKKQLQYKTLKHRISLWVYKLFARHILNIKKFIFAFLHPFQAHLSVNKKRKNDYKINFENITEYDSGCSNRVQDMF